MSWLSSFFLHPGLAWFLPLAAIPIILHLLMLHRLKTVELSTYRFLFDSYVQQRRRMKFLEALLAMLRTLFLLFLVLVFCRPVVKHWNELFKTGTGHDVVMLIDSSASMNAKTAGQSAFDRAKAAAQTVVQRLTPQDRLTLIRVADKPEEVASQFVTDPEALRLKIDELKTTPARANLFAAFMHLFGPEAEPRPNTQVYVFTDCQASGWREVRNQGLDRHLPADLQLTVVNVGSSKPIPNLAVIGDAPRRNRAIVGLPVFLQARVVYHAKDQATEPAEVTVKVFIDEKEITRHQLTLKPGETAVKKIQYYPTEPGVHRGRFEITGKTPDQFPDDDHYLFTLHVVPQLKVVLVNGNPVFNPDESECFYLSNALYARREPTPAEKQAEEKRLKAMGLSKDFFRSLDVQEVHEPQLNAEVLRDASVVILANCGSLNAQQFAWLRDFVAAGGGLLIFPGDRVNPTVYNTQFFTVANNPQEPLTPVRLGNAEGNPDMADTFERLAAIDYSHPILSVFDVANNKFFEAVLFQRRFPLTVPEKKDNVWTLATFTKGNPALVESRYGDGIVLLAAFPAHVKWTNLPARGGHAFVPLVLRSVSHAQHRPPVEGPRTVAPNGVAEIAVTRAWGAVGGTVTNPAGHVSTLEFVRSGPRMVAAFEGTSEKGYYTVEVTGGRSDPAQGTTTAFAVNLAPEESDFTILTENQFRELLPTANLTLVDASAEAQQDHNLNDSGNEIWRWLIWILFPLIIVEFMLATLGGQRTENEETPTVAERIRQLSPGSWVGRMTGALRRGTTE